MMKKSNFEISLILFLNITRFKVYMNIVSTKFKNIVG